MWVLYSSIMFAGSVVQYVLLRKAQEAGVHNKLNTFMYFAPFLPFMAVYMVLNKIPFLIDLKLLIVMCASAFLFSYVGIVLSILAIKEAPNVGYSLIIQKSYAIYTAFAAIFLFGAKLSVIGFLAILIIILFSGTIIIDRSQRKKTSSKRWLCGIQYLPFLFGNLILVSKYLQLQRSECVDKIFYSALTNCIFNGIDVYRNRAAINFKIKPSLWATLITMGLSVGIFNLGLQFGLKNGAEYWLRKYNKHIIYYRGYFTLGLFFSRQIEY